MARHKCHHDYDLSSTCRSRENRSKLKQPTTTGTGAHNGSTHSHWHLLVHNLASAAADPHCQAPVHPFLSHIMLSCLLSPPHTSPLAQVLEHKLRLLDAFLLEAADRRRTRGFRGNSPSAFGATSAAAGGSNTAAGMPAAAAGSGGGGLFGGGYLEDGSNRLNAAAGAAAMAAGGGYGGGGFGGSMMAPGVGGVHGPMGMQPAGAPAAKRQRLWSAAMAEEQRNSAIRVLASKAAQALFLLRTLTAANVNRLVLRLADATRSTLKELVSLDG